MSFDKLNNKSINLCEKEINDYWDKINILDKSIDKGNDKDLWVFYDGPATANGNPGLHHMLAKFLKDTFCKYETMIGKKVYRKVGWDTHGLPVEVQVEKELGFNGKEDIEKYGIEAFNKKCRESVWANEKHFASLTREMGQFIDLENPYVTYDNNYIETEWYILKKFFEEDMFYEGVKILPYCPRCGTGLSSHEVAQGYKEIPVNTVYLPFKMKDEDTYFLVWTTTPWTLMANLALCVNPKEKYVKVNSKGYNFILAKDLAKSILGDDIEIVEEYKGKDLEGIEYEQLMPFVDSNIKNAFKVLCDEYVTMSDGTGVVHIAPAYGEDDAKVCKKYKVGYVNPVGDDGCYTEGPWKGRLVTDTDLELEIIDWLKSNDKLFKKQKMTHNYPHCWRCHSPLVYYSKPSFYLEVTKIQDKIMKANKEVRWVPSYVGEKRFGNWLENMNDWAISRSRYWGCPLPLWRCECGHDEMIGSREELAEKAVEKVDPKTIDLHRPYVDDIHIKCPKCGKEMTRVKDVIDCWFDSGAMPFAQYHYPFENVDFFEKQFPADFICEGIDQTRGWFYSLIVISVFLKGVSPYKSVLVNDLLLDKNGQKMHKSKGNAIEPFTMLEKYGADTIRYYLAYASPVWTPLKFDEDGVKEIYSKYTATLKNLYSFFEMYANADHIDPREFDIPVEKRELIDKWLLSKLNKLVKEVTIAYEEYDLNKVTRAVIPFLNDDFSNWYIRSTRRRFWDSELTESKKAVYLTTYEVLLTLVKLMAPITPFLTEEIYMKLTGEESVHLADFPKYDKDLLNKKAEERMDLVREVCSLGRNAREGVNIKVRQPIQTLILPKKDEKVIGDLLPIIQEELNVKEVHFERNMDEYLEYTVKPNFKEVGKVLGNRVKLLQEALENITTEQINKIKDGGLVMSLGGDDYTITEDMVIITLKQKTGYATVASNITCVVLDTNLTRDLILEGLAREFVRNVQNLRKEADFVITDHINVYYNGGEDIEEMFKKYKDYIMREVLGEKLIKDEKLDKEYDLNDVKCYIKVEKV
ncbi:MAG: isoleucine--tRNA ligase [Bacilli bacterium]|nr:isoleucine--tRNA ligase [Bacilli bacterium]